MSGAEKGKPKVEAPPVVTHYSELAPQERAQHDEVVLESIWLTQTSVRARSRVKDPLQIDKLYRRRTASGERVLPFASYLAGMRIAWLYEIAGMHERTISRYSDGMIRGDAQNREARRGDAYHQWHTAMRLVTPWGANEVWEVCCMDYPAGGAARTEILRRALAYLYGRRNEWWGDGIDEADLLPDGG